MHFHMLCVSPYVIVCESQAPLLGSGLVLLIAVSVFLVVGSEFHSATIDNSTVLMTVLLSQVVSLTSAAVFVASLDMLYY